MRTDFENELRRHGLPGPSRTVDAAIVGRDRRPVVLRRRVWIPTLAAMAAVVAIVIIWPDLARQDTTPSTEWTATPGDRIDAIVADLCQGTSTDGRIDPAFARELRGAIAMIRTPHADVARVLDECDYAFVERDPMRVAIVVPEGTPASAVDDALGAHGARVESRIGDRIVARFVAPVDTWRMARRLESALGPTFPGIRVGIHRRAPAPRTRPRFAVDWMREDDTLLIGILHERADGGVARARFIVLETGVARVAGEPPTAKRLESAMLAIDWNRVANGPASRVTAAEVDRVLEGVLAERPDLAGFVPVPTAAVTMPRAALGADRVVALEAAPDKLTFYFRDLVAKEQAAVVRPRPAR